MPISKNKNGDRRLGCMVGCNLLSAICLSFHNPLSNTFRLRHWFLFCIYSELVKWQTEYDTYLTTAYHTIRDVLFIIPERMSSW